MRCPLVPAAGVRGRIGLVMLDAGAVLDAGGIQRALLGVRRCSLVLPRLHEHLGSALQIWNGFLVPNTLAFFAFLVFGGVGVVLEVLGHVASAADLELGALALRIHIRHIARKSMLTLYLVMNTRQLSNERLNMHLCRAIAWRCFTSSRAEVSERRLLQMLPIGVQALPMTLIVVSAAAKREDVSFVARGYACPVSRLQSDPPLLQCSRL